MNKGRLRFSPIKWPERQPFGRRTKQALQSESWQSSLEASLMTPFIASWVHLLHTYPANQNTMSNLHAGEHIRHDYLTWQWLMFECRYQWTAQHCADLPKADDGVEDSTIFFIMESHLPVFLCIRNPFYVQSPRSHSVAGNQRCKHRKRIRLHQELLGMSKNQIPEQYLHVGAREDVFRKRLAKATGHLRTYQADGATAGETLLGTASR
jgi:hypothetical protein